MHRLFKSAQTQPKAYPGRAPKQEIEAKENAQDHETVLRPARNDQQSNKRRKPARKQNRAAHRSTEMHPQVDSDYPCRDHSSAEHQSKESRCDQGLSKRKGRDDDIGKSREDPK